MRVLSLLMVLLVSFMSTGILVSCGGRSYGPHPGPMRTQTIEAGAAHLRVMAFNVPDITPDEVSSIEPSDRLRKAAAIIQRIAPDVLILNEIAYTPGGENAQLFAQRYLNVSQPLGRPGLTYTAYAWPSNTGVSSGFDFDNNSEAVTTPGSREYGGDSFGYGEYQGQYAMAILVRDTITFNPENVRTFQNFLWKDMPGALLPVDPQTGQQWYNQQEQSVFRLSSKSHWDVPVTVANGSTVHLLISHPTPPVFDGPEDRNGRRNHDEIRFWLDYISAPGDGSGRDGSYIYDDQGLRATLPANAHFVIAGDLNADPRDPSTKGLNPARDMLKHPRVSDRFVPYSNVAIEGLSPTATAQWGKRVDYVQPSSSMEYKGGGVWRNTSDDPLGILLGANVRKSSELFEGFPSDHFPVWVHLVVPAP